MRSLGVVLFGVRKPVHNSKLGVRAVEVVVIAEDGRPQIYRRNILARGNPKDEPLLTRKLTEGHEMMSDLYALERDAMDKIHQEPEARLRERLSVLNRLPTTPERSQLRAAIVRLLRGK